MGTSQTRYTAEFRAEAVKQVVERGYPVREVAMRLGVSPWSLYQWLRAHREADGPAAAAAQDAAAEIRRLRSELRRVTEERDILKKATAYFAKQST
jgi:transposase